ncbi:MAG: 3-hydroxyanthranilate 3,4-dioxygenase [Acidobacteriota bacterium]|nr:MAG: 3-hydroxyanthranilate 3,4-dioxygenase [Acidobacteriota bacterium]
MNLGGPFHLRRWIDEHREHLRPPVGNRMVFEDHEFLVMVVGGPNRRKDFHVEDGEELFYQIEGDIVVRVMDDGGPRDVTIREGEIFLLPARVPHSPQRPEGTVGLVVERQRRPGEIDHLRWYCEGCGGLLHDAAFELVDLGSQLKPLIEQFAAREDLRTCRACGRVMEL